MTSAHGGEPRFAWISQHGGPVVNWADAYRHRVTGGGLEGWSGSSSGDEDKPDELRKHVECAAGLRMLMVRLTTYASPGEGPIRWESTLKLADDRYVRTSGSAVDFSAALAQCEGHTHESRTIGALTWWRESKDHWVSWLGPFSLTARKFTRSGKDAYWRFESAGEASTLEEAALLASLGRSHAAVGGDQ